MLKNVSIPTWNPMTGFILKILILQKAASSVHNIGALIWVPHIEIIVAY